MTKITADSALTKKNVGRSGKNMSIHGILEALVAFLGSILVLGMIFLIGDLVYRWEKGRKK